MRDAVVRRADGTAIAVSLGGAPDGAPWLLCHGLADSRVFAQLIEPAAQAADVLVVAPDRPGTGGSEFRLLPRLVDWTGDARAVLDALEIERASVLGISAGGPFAAACAAALRDRVRALALVSPLGRPEWGTLGMAPSGLVWAAVTRASPSFQGWVMSRLAVVAQRSPGLFLRIATSGLPAIDREALARPKDRDAYLAGYLDAFRSGAGGVAQDLRLLSRPWGFDLASIRAPASVHHGDADTTVPPQHARRYAAAIPGAKLHVHAGHGHFSLDLSAAGVFPAATA